MYHTLEDIRDTQIDINGNAQWILDNCVIIDTETTGLGENDVVIELSAIRASNGEVLVDSLIRPMWLMHPAAAKVNKIDETELFNNGAMFAEKYSELTDLSELEGTYITSFNRSFDERLCRQSAFKAFPLASGRNWNKPEDSICIMELANRAFAHHLEWDAEQAKFKRLSLAKCLEIAGIEFDGEPHRALTDAKATLELVKYIANGGR
jgi:DNA polymerase-3 subunit epsilon